MVLSCPSFFRFYVLQVQMDTCCTSEVEDLHLHLFTLEADVKTIYFERMCFVFKVWFDLFW
jgi:hypothetical protein